MFYVIPVAFVALIVLALITRRKPVLVVGVGIFIAIMFTVNFVFLCRAMNAQ